MKNLLDVLARVSQNPEDDEDEGSKPETNEGKVDEEAIKLHSSTYFINLDIDNAKTLVSSNIICSSNIESLNLTIYFSLYHCCFYELLFDLGTSIPTELTITYSKTSCSTLPRCPRNHRQLHLIYTVANLTSISTFSYKP